jgi:hypothetical protein
MATRATAAFLLVGLALGATTGEFDTTSAIADEFSKVSKLASAAAVELGDPSNTLLPGQDTVTLINDPSPGSGSGSGYDIGEDATDHAKDSAMLLPLDQKLRQVDVQMSKARQELKAARRAALKMVMIQAKLKALEAKKEKIMITKKKIILENRLDHQTTDLNGIDRMAETLRDKFSDLQHTQQVLQESIDGTRSGLAYLAQMSPGIPNGPAAADGARIVKTMAGSHDDEVSQIGDTQDQNQGALVHMLSTLLKTPEEKLTPPAFVEEASSMTRNSSMLAPRFH